MCGVVFGQTLEIASAREIRHRRTAIGEVHAVRLDAVQMTHRRVQLDVVDVIGSAPLGEIPALGYEFRRVWKNHGLPFESVARCEYHPAAPEAAAGHRLDHHVNVARVIEMLVRDRERVEYYRVARRHRGFHAQERWGPGIDMNLGY